MPLIKILQWLSIAIRINPKILSMAFSTPHELYPLPTSPTTSQDNLGKEVITSTMLLWAHTVCCPKQASHPSVTTCSLRGLLPRQSVSTEPFSSQGLCFWCFLLESSLVLSGADSFCHSFQISPQKVLP